MSPEAARDFAIAIIDAPHEMFGKTNEREKASVACAGARGLGTLEFEKIISEAIDKWAKVIEFAGIKAE